MLIRDDLFEAFPYAHREAETLWRTGFFCHPLSPFLRYGSIFQKANFRLLADQSIPASVRLHWLNEWFPGADAEFGIYNDDSSPYR